MIPCRVKLSGFLSYKDEQEIRFDGSQLWMLAGVNGSGKSTIFDAITYALFGTHRGGSQQAHELINKESNALSVEFDFRLDGKLYRAKRTLKRTAKGGAAGTQQIFRFESEDGNGKGRWSAVADTGKKVEFDAWVRDNIGLNYDTFTSSVLLLQGKAEKLLDSKPSGRAEVLAGIVDLQRYQRLHEKADHRRRDLKARLETLQNQFDAVAEVTDEQLAAAEAQIQDAEAARKEAFAKVEQAQALEYRAEQWAELRQRLGGLRERMRQAESLLSDAAEIEKRYQRLRELREVLPHVNTIVTVRSEIGESERKSEGLRAELNRVTEQRGQTEHAQQRAKRQREELQKRLAEDERKLREVSGQLRELSGVMSQVRLMEDQQVELSRLEEEARQLPARPEGDLLLLEKEKARRERLGQALAHLKRFAEERSGLKAAAVRAADAEAEEKRVRTEGEALKARLAEAKKAHDDATRARREADEESAAARALAQQADAALHDFERLEGQKVCRQCGQPLTPAHFQSELAKRRAECAEADDRLSRLQKRQEEARRREQALAEEVAHMGEQLEKLREAYKDSHFQARQAAQDVARHAAECGRIYLDLPDELRSRIAPEPPADWTDTAFPTPDDLREVAREAGGLEQLKRELRQALDISEKRRALRARTDAVRQSLERLRQGLPSGDPTELRRREASLKSEETALTSGVEAVRKALQDNEREGERLTKELTRLQQQFAELNGRLKTEEVTRAHAQATIDRARQALPEPWRREVDAAGLTAQHQWKMELDELTATGIEKRYEQLQQALHGLEALRREIAEREADEAAFPEEARREPDEVRELLRQAREEAGRCDERFQHARQEHGLLTSRRKQREAYREQLLDAEREHNLYALLSQLLGRDRLQRHLVRQAERQIVDYANAVLDRLSAGELCLRLCGGDDGSGADRALELEAYNRTTGGSPINVAFLSGSQRFRVAVSLAVGIGQYASRQHRPIESVIIDEGFGCLDRQGRQGMIQELQNLRGQLHCILLVSHQEEFAEAFPDGYRFVLEDGSTKVTRIRR